MIIIDDDGVMHEVMKISEVIDLLTKIVDKIDGLNTPYYCSHYRSGLRDAKNAVRDEIKNIRTKKDSDIS